VRLAEASPVTGGLLFHIMQGVPASARGAGGRPGPGQPGGFKPGGFKPGGAKPGGRARRQ